MNLYLEAIANHYKNNWGGSGATCVWDKGPREELPEEFTVLEFSPTSKRSMWTYATACMSQPGDESPVELHLFSPQSSQAHVELLTAIAHYHRNEAQLDLGHTVNFGRPWIPGSQCDHGLISLPSLDGPDLENLNFDDIAVRFLWLIPITTNELEFKKQNGVEALEEEFDQHGFNYLDPLRESIV